MINRILIRTKVVQILYSYLLTEKHFTLESLPSSPTKEKRFAYNIYIDTLLMIQEIAEKITKGKSHPLNDDNPFILALESEDIIRARRQNASFSESSLSLCVDLLADKIKASGLYKQYLKHKGEEPNAEVNVWKQIFDFIIWPDSQFNLFASKQKDYSLSGMDRMKTMMDNTFINFMSSNSGWPQLLINLRKSLDKARELYFTILMLPIAITSLRDQEIDFNRSKNFPTESDLNPDMALVENRLITLMRQNVLLKSYVESHKIDPLLTDDALIKHLLKKIKNSEIYAQYISSQSNADEEEQLKRDCHFWRQAIRDLILPDEEFLETLETKSVFWNDDIDIMAEFAIKTIKRFEDGMGQNSILPMYKDEEDAKFGEELAKIVLNNKNEYRILINNNLRKEEWDTDRLALMDVIILITAIAEILNFPKIPLRVSINEYIEIAKAYSTPKSGTFINGMLSVIIKELQAKGALTKK